MTTIFLSDHTMKIWRDTSIYMSRGATIRVFVIVLQSHSQGTPYNFKYSTTLNLLNPYVMILLYILIKETLKELQVILRKYRLKVNKRTGAG